MNIGEVSKRAGIPAKTIRYYEDIELIRPHRGKNGYRDFRADDLHKLTFIGRARALGFSIDDCRTLLALYEDGERESAQVKAVARDHLLQIDQKIAQLQSMRGTLAHLIQCCQGDDRPDCPILEDLSGNMPDQMGTGRA